MNYKNYKNFEITGENNLFFQTNIGISFKITGKNLTSKFTANVGNYTIYEVKMADNIQEIKKFDDILSKKREEINVLSHRDYETRYFPHQHFLVSVRYISNEIILLNTCTTKITKITKESPHILDELSGDVKEYTSIEFSFLK